MINKKDSKNDIAKAVCGGIAESQKAYERLSGGEWAWMAPEYWMTTEVARQLGSVDPDRFNVTLESGVRDILEAGGGIRRGRPAYASRIDGRFDAVVWDEHGYPIGVVEVKRQTPVDNVREDVLRIAEVLKMRAETSTISFGVIGYYFSSRPVVSRSAEINVADRLNKLQASVRDWVGENMPTRVWVERSNADDSGDVWGACSICIG
ncbi:hypothetical protein [Thioalkalivibrio sp. ALE23]|uniref:hypothetical protein n=1 Tax=Thioalkalivibrio sp. ALE23 TaxID=1265495 RepID=UPI0012DC6F2C|nr:hypothetical protein [Thioalkalivibrio sp. ALE23]